jgi:hypothetical protein
VVGGGGGGGGVGVGVGGVGGVVVVVLVVIDIQSTVHRDKFLIIKPTKCTNFSNLFLKGNSTCFGQFLCPASGVFCCAHSNGICHTGYANCLLVSNASKLVS